MNVTVVEWLTREWDFMCGKRVKFIGKQRQKLLN